MFDTSTPLETPLHATIDHPKIPKQKVGVLVSNLGTPDKYDYCPMRRYLNEFLSDRRVIDYSPFLWQPLLQLLILTSRPFRSGAAYKSIWNEERSESPLLTITKDQTAAIKKIMQQQYGDGIVVEFCMRYGNPSTKSKVRSLVSMGCSKILFFPLYPHYAGATSATANDQFFRALMNEKWPPSVRTVAPYFDNSLPRLTQVFLADFNGKLLHNMQPLYDQIHKNFNIQNISPILNKQLIPVTYTHLTLPTNREV